MRELEPLKWSDISKYRGELFGLSIISIIFLHVFENFSALSNNPVYSVYFGAVGSVGVDIFLFLSGFGIWFALEKKPRITEFYIKRINRVVIPYCLVGIVYWVLVDFLMKKVSVGRFLYDYTMLSFWGEGIRSYWYISLICILYFAAPFVAQIKKTPFIVLNLAIIAASVVLFLINRDYFSKIEIGILRINVFLIGLYCAKLARRGEIISNKLMLFFAFSVPLKIAVGLADFPFARIFNAYYAVFLIVLYMLIRRRIQDGRLFFKAIGFVGNYTLELYLIHVSMRSLLGLWNINLNGYWKCLIWTVSSIPLTIGFSIMLKKLKGIPIRT